jgi:hypothetical protein
MHKLISMLLFLRIAIINISGNTGKTTVAMHGVDNALPDAEIICVESLNEIPKIDGQNLTTMKAEEADKLFEKMLISRNREQSHRRYRLFRRRAIARPHGGIR